MCTFSALRDGHPIRFRTDCALPFRSGLTASRDSLREALGVLRERLLMAAGGGGHSLARSLTGRGAGSRRDRGGITWAVGDRWKRRAAGCVGWEAAASGAEGSERHDSTRWKVCFGRRRQVVVGVVRHTLSGGGNGPVLGPVIGALKVMVPVRPAVRVPGLLVSRFRFGRCFSVISALAPWNRLPSLSRYCLRIDPSAVQRIRLRDHLVLGP